MSILLLDTGWIAPEIGWRFAFGLGAFLGLVILALRHFVPESPRWLLTHGREAEANRIVSDIESKIAKHASLPEAKGALRLCARKKTPWGEIWRAMTQVHRRRSLLGLTLMTAQAFFYNGVFFTYGLVLIRFYGVRGERIGFYLLPLALGNFLGPIIYGRLFDSIGRKPMIAATYALAGVLLLVSAALFASEVLTAWTQALAWTAIFFVASSASSSAYLTVSEIFPLEIRALAIAIFYACGTLVGGVAAPALFGALIGSGSRGAVAWGYAGAALLMIAAAIVEAAVGVRAERRSLESIAAPLTSRPTSA